MRYLPKSIDNLDLVDAMNTRTQAPMHAENLIVDHHAQREKIEHVGKIMPDIRIAVFAVAFSVKPVRLSYAARFVITADEVDPVRIAKL